MPPHSRLGTYGIWSGVWSDAQRGVQPYTPEFDEAAAELDELGFGALWMGGSPSPAWARRVLEATSRMTVATGILSIWEHDPADVAAERASLDKAHPGRFLLGLGVSHGHFSARYAQPYSAMRNYLDALDAAGEPVPADSRVLAALGPKMLSLSRDRAAGAHPYLVTVEHTAEARGILGPDVLLAPELKVVLDTDLDKARATARGYLSYYLPMPNYSNNLLRLGFTEDDFRDGGSDRLVDALFVLGDADAVTRRAADFLAAGADHLALQVVTDSTFTVLPRWAWRRLAEALPLRG